MQAERPDIRYPESMKNLWPLPVTPEAKDKEIPGQAGWLVTRLAGVSERWLSKRRLFNKQSGEQARKTPGIRLGPPLAERCVLL